MKHIVITLLVLLLGSQVFGQYCTNNDRFTEIEYFTASQIDSSMNVTYATVNNQPLELDLYYPNNSIDTLSKRPFIFLIHGGGYVAGTRGIMRNTCVAFAQRGFVTATITHRLDSGIVTTLDPIYKAEQDAHAAMRYLVNNASTYKIDTAWIFTGGESSGANTALAMAYTDQADYDTLNPGVSVTNGGLYTSGNSLTDTYTIKGVYNNWGSVISPSFDTLRNVSIISFHGEQDPIINIDLNMRTFRGGSRWIYQAAASFGHCNSLNIDPTGGHGVYGLGFRVPKAACFFKSVFCNTCTSDSSITQTPASCALATALEEALPVRDLTAYPNPFDHTLRIKGLRTGDQVILYNTMGQIVYQSDSQEAISTYGWAPGMYILEVRGNNSREVLKIVKSGR